MPIPLFMLNYDYKTLCVYKERAVGLDCFVQVGLGDDLPGSVHREHGNAAVDNVHAVGGGDEAVDCLAVVVDRFGLGRRRGATGDESAGRQVQAGGVRRAPRARGGRIVDVDRLRVRSLKIVLAPQRQRRGTAQQNREKMFGFHIIAPFVSYRCRVYRTHPRHRSSHRFPTEDLKQNCDAGM